MSDDSQRVPMTPQGFRMLKDELSRLKSQDRPRIVREIEEARAHGDLSENAEYHAAKEKQGLIESRIAVVDDKLARAQVIDPTGQEADRVRFGATVVIADTESGDENTYRIVGEDEADAKEGRISVTSPVARALLGQGLDAEVKIRVPKGTREVEIRDIRYE